MMKLVTCILVVLIAIGLAAYPPQFGRAQKSVTDTQPVLSLSDPIDTAGMSPTTAALVDSFNSNYLRISAKADTVIALAREIENRIKKPRYEVTVYKPPVSVMKLRFENKDILAQWDSTRGVFVEKEVVIK